MGISLYPFHFLATCERPWGSTLTLGRQDNNLPKNLDLIHAILEEGKLNLDPDVFSNERYADKIFLSIGASDIISMDASSYEGAEIIHDLNKPIPSDLIEKFDTIIDGGTLEHIYHIPNALENIARMLRIGGRFISLSIANNWAGHGFYQFSPELMWRFCKGFGFEVKRICLYERNRYPKPIIVPDCLDIGRRLEIQTPNHKIDLMTEAIKRENIFPKYLYQSDYVDTWKKNSATS